MNDENYSVYVEIDKENKIERIFTTFYCKDEIKPTHIFIGSGNTDEYKYLDIELFDNLNCHNYKLVGNKMIECTPEEKLKELESVPTPVNIQEKIRQYETELVQSNQYITDLELKIIEIEKKLS